MTAATLEITDKQIVRGILDRLPDTSSMRDIRNEIALLEALQQSEADYEAGNFISNEEAKRRTANALQGHLVSESN